MGTTDPLASKPVVSKIQDDYLNKGTSRAASPFLRSNDDFGSALVLLARALLAFLFVGEGWFVLRGLAKWADGDLVYSTKPLRFLLFLLLCPHPTSDTSRWPLRLFVAGVWGCARGWIWEEQVFGAVVGFLTLSETYTAVVFGSLRPRSSRKHVYWYSSSHDRFASRVRRARAGFRRCLFLAFAAELLLETCLGGAGAAWVRDHYASNIYAAVEDHLMVRPRVAQLVRDGATLVAEGVGIVARARKRTEQTARDGAWELLGVLHDLQNGRDGTTEPSSGASVSFESVVQSPAAALRSLFFCHHSLLPLGDAAKFAVSLLSKRHARFLRSVPDESKDLWLHYAGEAGGGPDTNKDSKMNSDDDDDDGGEEVFSEEYVSELLDLEEEESGVEASAGGDPETARVLHMAASAGWGRDWVPGDIGSAVGGGEGIPVAVGPAAYAEQLAALQEEQDRRAAGGSQRAEGGGTGKETSSNTREQDAETTERKRQAAARRAALSTSQRKKRRERRARERLKRHPLAGYNPFYRRTMEAVREWLHTCPFDDLEGYVRWHIGTQVAPSKTGEGARPGAPDGTTDTRHWTRFLRCDTCAELRRAYRRVALEFHPDRFSGVFCAHFRDGAFRVLQNLLEERKKQMHCSVGDSSL
eukprot:g18206.t1